MRVWEHVRRRGGPLVATGMATLLLATGVGTAPPAGAAGETTHAWMSRTAVEQVEDADLKALLEAHPDLLRSGTFYPDAGYYSPNTFGEEAHWQRYHDALAARIRDRDDCPDLTDPDGPCAPLIAFLMGAIAHGMGDEVWDWLFEPYVADLEEYY